MFIDFIINKSVKEYQEKFTEFGKSLTIDCIEYYVKNVRFELTHTLVMIAFV